MSIFTFTFLLIAFSSVTSLIVEAIKKLMDEKENLRYNIIVLTVAMVVGVIGTLVYFYMTNRRRNATYAFLVPAICVGFVIATVTECLFLPFEVFPAFAYWFVFGDLFEKKVEEKELVDEGQGEDPEPIDEGQGGAL